MPDQIQNSIHAFDAGAAYARKQTIDYRTVMPQPYALFGAWLDRDSAVALCGAVIGWTPQGPVMVQLDEPVGGDYRDDSPALEVPLNPVTLCMASAAAIRHREQIGQRRAQIEQGAQRGGPGNGPPATG